MTYNKNTWANHDLITSQKLNNIEDGINDVIDRVTYGTGGAEQPTQPIHTPVYLNLGDPLPTDAVSGDYAFIKDGDDFTIMEFNGVKWVEQINPNLKERIADVLAQAETRSQELVDKNATAIGATLDEVQAKQADLTAQQAELDTKAKGYADKALADAKANTLATATQTAKDASDALVKAKTDLTTSLNKEVTDRTKAVSDLDTKAQGYATQAKTDAIATANGAVAKEVTDRQKAITDLDAKSTGAINQAKIDAQSALDALSTGDRNYILDTGNQKRLLGYGKDNFDYFNQAKLYKTLQSWGTTAGAPYVISFDWTLDTPLTADMNASVFFNQSPWQEQRYVIPANQKSGHATFLIKLNAGLLTQQADITSLTFRVNNQLAQGNALTISNLYMKSGNVPTDYTQAPEDIVLDYTTKDNVISQSLTQYQATNDGKVTKAQSDATQALGLVATKVSQTDYNTKTGDLDSKYTAVKQTADQASTDIVAIKSTNTSQDTKINTLTSDVSGTKQSISDIQTEQGKQSTKINTIQTDVSGTKQDISDIKDANGVQDGKIASISTTVDGLSSSFSTYKTTNDGKVAKAQADITANATAISQKVSQTAYDTKTGQLQTDLNTTTATANTSKQDIVAIKSDNTKQDARMTTIESDANGTKTTVRNLQTDLGKANGSISTLQQRADGFDATVTKVNNLSVGDRNYILDTANPKTQTSNGKDNQDIFDQAKFYSPIKNWGIANGDYIISFDWDLKTALASDMQALILFNQSPWQPQSFTVKAGQLTGHVDLKFKLYPGILTATNDVTSLTFRIMSQMASGNTITYSNLFMKSGTISTTWTPAPEDLSSATAKAQLKADNATLSINNYKIDADGRISRAQSDITATASEVKTKVSQTDYNAKTGDLTTKVNTAQSTADSATSTIGAYKTSNDARVASAESKITANATAITQKVSQTDYNTKTGQIDGQISTINQTAGQISQSVSNVKAQVDGLSVGGRNLLLNTKALWTGGIGNNGSKVTLTLEAFDSTTNMWHLVAPQQAYNNAGIYFYNGAIQPGDNWALSFDVKGTGNWSSNGARVENSTVTKSVEPLTTSWARVSSTGKKVSAGGAVIFYFDLTNSPLDVYIKLPKLEYGNMPTSWTPAPEDTDNKISTVSQTVDDISSIVSDPTTGLTKRVQTAEGTLSQVTGADIPALQKATYWQAPNGYDLNTYLTQGSTFFRDTTARTNAPTTSTKWMYLVVERTPNGDRVTQTAWYDTQTDAKITYRRQYAGTWGAWYANDNDSVTSIAQTNGAIQQEVKDRTNGDSNTLTQSKGFTTSSITNYDKGMQSQLTQTSDAIIAKIEATNLVTNSEFDPDNVGWYKLPADGSTIDVSGKVTTPIKSYYADWDAVNGSRGMEFGATTGTWITSEPIRASSTGTYSISVLAGRPIAPATAVTMDFRLGLWDKDKKYITSVGSTNPLNGTTYLPLKYYKSENITVPSNTAFVSFVLGHSGSGTPDAIYHPMINHGATISPYTPTYGTTASSTVLSLLKDNWSIGIADNAGAITNGIVGNSTNMSLISNNVVINAPSTQIKGTAWINSAMIGNGAVGRAQIGDASIDTAKIASLDVAKLTGNVSNFIQSNWNGIYSSVAIDGSGMRITTGGTVTTLDQWGTHWSRGNLNSLYGFGYWRDSSGNNTTSTGLYMGVTGSENAFINILGTNGAAAAVLAGSQFDHGANTNIAPGAFNFFTNVNIRTQLAFKGNVYNSPSYIESNEATRTLNFFTGGGSQGGGNYFYFNQNVLSAGTFSSTSRLSQKIVDSPYTEDALGEISKTQLVNFAYKNRPDQNHVSPIIDDVNDTKEYYIPKTILGQDGEYVDMYTMISMAWKALQQVNDRLEKLESR